MCCTTDLHPQTCIQCFWEQMWLLTLLTVYFRFLNIYFPPFPHLAAVVEKPGVLHYLWFLHMWLCSPGVTFQWWFLRISLLQFLPGGCISGCGCIFLVMVLMHTWLWWEVTCTVKDLNHLPGTDRTCSAYRSHEGLNSISCLQGRFLLQIQHLCQGCLLMLSLYSPQ